MKFGAYIHRDVSLRRAGPRLEELGFDCLAVGEHVSFHAPTAQSLTALSFLAAVTSRISLLSAILLAPLYPPALLAKMVAELGVYSEGRFLFGVGVGGENPREFDACGVPVSERDARMDELVPLVQRLLSEPAVSHRGKFWAFDEVSIEPRPAAVPEFWMGGRGARAIDRAARFGSVWMPYLYTPDDVERSRAELSEAATRVGRPPAAVTTALFAFVSIDRSGRRAKSIAVEEMSRLYGRNMERAVDRYVIAGTPRQVIARIAEYRAAGVECVICSTLGRGERAHFRAWSTLAAEVIPAFR
jgi:alkanesulfonate monooxygenase SsuD/methylene tetrahydromethanopterin reductase-like flavin-dependent oxidoreductase (luciferase family)